MHVCMFVCMYVCMVATGNQCTANAAGTCTSPRAANLINALPQRLVMIQENLDKCRNDTIKAVWERQLKSVSAI